MSEKIIWFFRLRKNRHEAILEGMLSSANNAIADVIEHKNRDGRQIINICIEYAISIAKIASDHNLAP